VSELATYWSGCKDTISLVRPPSALFLQMAKTWGPGKEANTKTNAISVHVYLMLVL